MSTQDETVFDRYRADVDYPLMRVFRVYGLPRKGWFIVGVVANLLAQFASLVPPVVLGASIDSLFAGDRPFRLPLVPAAWLPTDPVTQFWFSVALIVSSFVATALFTWIYGVTANQFAHGVMHYVRADSFRTMLRLDMAFFDDKQTGEVMSVLDNDAGNLELFLDNALMNSIRLVIMVGGISLVLFSLNPGLALVTLVIVPLMVGFTWWFMRTIKPLYRTRQRSRAQFNTRLENGISGVLLAKATASEDYEQERTVDASRRLFEDTMSVLKISYFYRPGMELLAGLSFGVTFIVGGYWIFTDTPPLFLWGDLTVGTFVVFIFMTQRFVAPLAEVSNIVDQIQNARVSAERVFGLYDIPRRIDDTPDAVALENPAGHVEYDHVSFAYSGGPNGGDWNDDDDGGEGNGESDDSSAPAADGGLAVAQSLGEGEEVVIEDVSIDIPPGETVAFVGSTGAGKSTLCKLLLRLYDVTDGEIRVDGHDIRDVTLDSLRSSVGYVAQDTFLFDGTIADNIRYGRFDADAETVREAARAAEAHEFIADLPEGYETRVGERGVKLSGGQRQRIAVARVVLQDPPILVLDEATSAVDTETERLIQRSLDRIAADRTTIIVAHRLSTVTDADTICVLEDGSVVERGTHDDLRDSGGRYAELWEAQTAGG